MLVIQGRIPSKKNSTWTLLVKGRNVRLPSKKYAEWHRDAVSQLKFQKYTLENEITLKIYAPDARKSDLTNKAESVMDTLVDCGFLEDDNWYVVSKLTLEFGGVDKENPRVEIYNTLDK